MVSFRIPDVNEACKGIDFKPKSKSTVITRGKYILTNYFSISQSLSGIVVTMLRELSNSCSLALVRTADGGARELMHAAARAPTLGSARVPSVPRFVARYICALLFHFLPLESYSPRTSRNLDTRHPCLEIAVNCSLTTLCILLQMRCLCS